MRETSWMANNGTYHTVNAIIPNNSQTVAYMYKVLKQLDKIHVSRNEFHSYAHYIANQNQIMNNKHTFAIFTGLLYLVSVYMFYRLSKNQ